MSSKFLTLSLALALAGGATSQEGKTEAVKTEATQQDPVKKEQDPPKKPAELDRIDELKTQLERARAELEATRRMVEAGGLPARVRPYLDGRKLAGRTVDLGVEAIPLPATDNAEPAAAAKTGVRLLGDAEKERYGPDVIFAVEEQPVTKAEFDKVFAYFAGRPGVAEADQAKRDAIRALVIQKASFARFMGSAGKARAKMAEVEKLLADGGDFADVARDHSQCPSAAQGGDLGQFGYGVMDPIFEMAAFTTKVGETSEVVQSAFGYHIVKVTGEEKGEQPKVRASHILVMFDQDQQAIRQAMMQAMGGQVDLAFADDDWRALSPF